MAREKVEVKPGSYQKKRGERIARREKAKRVRGPQIKKPTGQKNLYKWYEWELFNKLKNRKLCTKN